MSTHTIVRSRLHADLIAGDRIVALNGHKLPAPRIVEAPQWYTPTGQRCVKIVNPLTSGTDWNLYPDQVDSVIVERADEQPEPQPEPQPAKPKRTRPTTRRTKYGLTLTFGLMRPDGYPSGAWETDDRDYSIQQGVGVTYCEGPHPMRWKDTDGFWRSGYCVGDQEHDYVVGWTIVGEQIPGVGELGEPHETLDAAWAFLAAALGASDQ